MTTQFAPAPAVSGEHAGNRFWPGFSVGMCAATVVAAVVATGALLTDRTTAAGFDVHGTVTLVGDTTASTEPGFACEGARGYDDLSPTTTVRITNGYGSLYAPGTFTGSAHGNGLCTFFFTVPDVPRGAADYDVEISHRGSVTYAESEVESGVHLTLGR